MRNLHRAFQIRPHEPARFFRIAALLLSLAAAARAADESPPPSPSGLRVLSRANIFVYPETDPYKLDNLYGFNHAPSVVTLPDGRLMCAWFSGPYEASVHQVILASTSSDQGQTWDRSFVLQDMPRVSDFDPAFIATGTETLFFYTAGRHIRWPFLKHQDTEVGPASFFVYLRRSSDSGQTWSDSTRIYQGGSRSNGIRLSSGELLLPVHALDGKGPAGVLRSTDQGRTWKRFGEVFTPAEQDEPTIAELADGTILMGLRTGDGFMWSSRSRDQGQTWEKPWKTDIVAARASHNLFRTSDGRVVLTHDAANVRPRTPLTMRITRDGTTWGKPLILAECEVPDESDERWEHQVAYPSVAEIPGRILVVVWTEITIGDGEQTGAIRSARVQLLE